MKKSLILLAAGILLTGCGGSQSNKDYYVVTYSNNYENAAYFKKAVVKKDSLLKRPNNPTRDGYVFEGWSTKPNEFVEFNSFDTSLNKDTTLYASWIADDENLTDLKKAELLKKYISWTEAPTIEAYRKTNMVGAYYSPVEFEFGMYSEDDFRRYNDHTVCDTYALEEDDETLVKISETNYTYDDKQFKKEYKDLEDSTNNEVTTSKFDASQVEDFLNIGFYNLNIRNLDNVINGLQNNLTEDDLFYYELVDFDLTKFDSSSSYFQFSFSYEQDIYNAEQGMTWQDIKTYDCSIHFKNNMIYKSKVVSQNANAVNGEILLVTVTTDEIEYTSGDINRVE